MIRIYRTIGIATLLLIALLVSGCYTVLEHPSPAEEGMIENKTEKGPIYRSYEDEDDYSYPYYEDSYYLDPYYGFWYPGSYYYGGYYGGYSRWYGDYYYYPRYYYNDRDYNYLPGTRPEVRKRGSSETIQRVPKNENKPGSRIENLEEDKESEKRTSSRREVERRTQSAPEKHRDTSSEIKRSSKSKDKDEEE